MRLGKRHRIVRAKIATTRVLGGGTTFEGVVVDRELRMPIALGGLKGRSNDATIGNQLQ
jgi:hypothetical protein